MSRIAVIIEVLVKLLGTVEALGFMMNEQVSFGLHGQEAYRGNWCSAMWKSSTNKTKGMSIKNVVKRSRETEGQKDCRRKKPRVPTERIKIVLHNARGFDALTEHDTVNLIKSQKPEVVGILETHLREEDGTRKVNTPEGYSKIEVRRSDLADDKDGGGIMVIYKRAQGIKIEQKNLKIRKKENIFVEKERIWVSVKTKEEKLAVGFVYMAAENRAEKNRVEFNRWNDSIYEVLEEDIRKLRKEGFKVILNGDMNGWVGCQKEGIPGNRKETNSNGLKFMDFLDRNRMLHLNGTEKCTGLYTRHSSNSATVLDYVSVSKEDLPIVKSVFVDENSVLGGNSDHVFVVTTLEQSYSAGPTPTTKTRQAIKWDIKEDTDWAKFRQKQTALLKEVPIQQWKEAETLGETLNTILVQALEDGVGKLEIKDRKPKQFPDNVRREIGKLKEVRSNWRAARTRMSKSPSNSKEHEMIEKEIKMQRQKDKVDELMSKFWRGERTKVFDKLSEGGVASTKLFWSYVANKSKSGQSFPFMQDPRSGEITSDQKEIKEIVEEFWKTMFHGSFEPVESRPVNDADLMEDDQSENDTGGREKEETDVRLEQEFTSSEVAFMIGKLKNSKAMGEDKVPNEALKNSTPEFVEAITKLFNNIRKEGKVPKGWKIGRLVLVHKKGSLTDVGNYRPLTVIVAMSGLFSRVLNERLTEVVEDKKLLGEVQQGFRRGRRGADNTFVLNTIIMKGVATGKKPHLAFLDIKKVVFKFII